MSWHHKGWLLSGLLVLCGCQQLQTPQQSQSAALAKLAEAQKFAAQAPATIQYAHNFYAPQLSEADGGHPAWFSQPIDLDTRSAKLTHLLTELLAPYQVSLQLLDDIPSDLTLNARFQGRLGDFITWLAREHEFYAEFDEQWLRLEKYQTGVFDVAFWAGETGYFMGADPQSNAQSVRGLSGIPNVTNDVANTDQYLHVSGDDSKRWDELEQAIRVLLSENGQVVLNRQSSSVLVRDQPPQLARVRNFLQAQNRRLTQQVAVDVQVLEVNFNDDNQRAVDWSLLHEVSGWQSALSAGLTNNDSTGQLSLLRTTGRMQGSQLLVKALTEQGTVTMSNHPRLLSLNNEVAKIAFSDNATYLASAGTTTTANVGSTEVLIPGVVNTGFELYVLPRVLDGKVLLQLSTSLSDLLSIDEISSGDQRIQTPHTNRKEFFMKAMVGNQQTLLLSGLKNERRSQRESEPFGHWLFGGGQTDEFRQSETLLLITPHIIETTP